MKFNIAYPVTGQQKLFEIKEEKKYRAFFDKRISHEVAGDEMGDEFKGYIFRVQGGNDKQGFPMMQGVLTPSRVRLLLDEKSKFYRAKRRGERKRRSVRGCIISHEIAVVSLVIVKKGDKDIEGLTDVVQKKRLGPKRASNIRKMFNLSKEDDVRKYVLRRDIMKDGKKVGSKAPKIQRLITPARLQRKRRRQNEKKQRFEKAKSAATRYEQLLRKKNEERKAKD